MIRDSRIVEYVLENLNPEIIGKKIQDCKFISFEETSKGGKVTIAYQKENENITQEIFVERGGHSTWEGEKSYSLKKFKELVGGYNETSC